MKKLIIPVFLIAASAAPMAQANQTLCVYDLLGGAGDMVNIAKDYAVAAQNMGAKMSIKAYTDERVATEDLKAGECDSVMATGFRTRQFNPTAAALDSLGVSTIIRNGKVDMPASYETVRKTI
ncbi:MAG: hypothetical protein KBT61_01390 [Paraperlucidibaca sp.]|nr:hypothetical protein [Paraperlucidibaca sp.]MBQ0841598.1 hypothetical protein [Paraperlucidibaca sp.]